MRRFTRRVIVIVIVIVVGVAPVADVPVAVLVEASFMSWSIHGPAGSPSVCCFRLLN